MKILILFALVLSLGISIGSGKVYQGLKVKGDFRKVQLLVEDVNPNGIVTKQDIENTVKLKLFSNNIKTIPIGSENLYLQVIILPMDNGVNFVYSTLLELKKWSFDYGVSESVAGPLFAPHQGIYFQTGICRSKDKFLSNIKEIVDRFLVDYIESNMED